jgi:aspartokinase
MTATHAQNLLLFFVRNDSAITTATHAQNLLLFFVRNDPANSKLHLIVAFIRRASTAQTNVDLISVSEGEHLIALIVASRSFSPLISLHRLRLFTP